MKLTIGQRYKVNGWMSGVYIGRKTTDKGTRYGFRVANHKKIQWVPLDSVQEWSKGLYLSN